MNAEKLRLKVEAYVNSKKGRRAFRKAIAQADATIAQLNKLRQVEQEELRRHFTI